MFIHATRSGHRHLTHTQPPAVGELRLTDTEPVCLLVPSWDGYRDVWPAFFHCFFRHWPDCPFPVVLGTNTVDYPDDRVATVRIGPDRSYSTNLRAMLARVAQPWIILMVDDVLLSAPVDTSRILDLIGRAQRQDATSLLLHDTNTRRILRREAGAIARFPTSTPYLTSLNPAVWKKQGLLDLLRDGEDAWAFETAGTRRAAVSGHTFYGVTDLGGGPPLTAVNALVKGSTTPEALDLLRREGFSGGFPGRPPLSRTVIWYRRLRPWIPGWLMRAWHRLR